MRRALWLLSAIILAGVIYDGWIFYSRWSGNREAARAQASKEAAQVSREIDAVGGGGLKILDFYAAPGAIRPGGRTSLCYGVTGAKTVRLEPPAGDPVWPALTRCVQVSPRKNTEYKLTADDEGGHSVMQTIEVTVR
ncbi:MAG TPA: hypothetical protein VGL82_07255 [Bryobacteraceae bacterium]|jgi:hypothetical protein